VKSAGFRARTAHLAGLAVFAGAETLLFLAVAARHYAWSYPRWNDQVQYLGQAYDTYELAKSAGYIRAAWSALHGVYAQGCLHELLPLPIFAALGASRTAALAVNMLAFLAWQAATFLAVRRISGRTSLAWASVGLLAALHFPWSGSVGSAVDFRLDWMAACAYGIALAVGISGRGFRSTPWAVLFGAVAGAAVLLRFLTLVYFGLIFLALLAWLLTRPDRRGRCGRLALSGAVAFGILAPEFWRSRATIYSYYWMGHFAGPERALRDSHLGVISSVRWILSQVVFNQVGIASMALGLGAAAIFLLSSGDPGEHERSAAGAEPATDGAWVLALAFFAAPVAVLAFHPEKSDPPSSILIPGAIWIILLLWVGLAKAVSRGTSAAVGAAVLGIGALVFVHAETRRSELDESAADFRGINGLADFLFFRAEEAGLTHPRVGVTWVLDGTEPGALRILGYERHGRMMSFIATLPTGLFRTSREIAMTALENSHFVCLATRADPVWPFDRQMEELRPAMREWCDAHMAAVGQLDVKGFSLSVYEERGISAHPGGVDLATLIGDASVGPAYANPGPPGPPVFVSSAHVAASTADEFRYRVVAAHSPVRYHAVRLPEGFTLDSGTGEIRGRFLHPGSYSAEVSASNAAGATSEKLEVHVEDEPWYGFLDAPSECPAGVPFDVSFGAYDRGGNLNFIDITDLTTRTLLRRLQVSEGQRQSWCATCRLTTEGPGKHVILMRFVRYTPDAKEPYSFVDHTFVVEIGSEHVR
jgi:hypothetical protein